jgi:hypothetical protein
MTTNGPVVLSLLLHYAERTLERGFGVLGLNGQTGNEENCAHVDRRYDPDVSSLHAAKLIQSP